MATRLNVFHIFRFPARREVLQTIADRIPTQNFLLMLHCEECRETKDEPWQAFLRAEKTETNDTFCERLFSSTIHR